MRIVSMISAVAACTCFWFLIYRIASGLCPDETGGYLIITIIGIGASGFLIGSKWE